MSKARTLADKATSGRKNLIINGQFPVFQRPIDVTVATSGYHGPDRWYLSAGGNSVRLRKSTNATIIDRLKAETHLLVSTTATSGPVWVGTRIEGGLSFSKQTVTLSYDMAAQVAGTYMAKLRMNFGVGGSPALFISVVNFASEGGTHKEKITMTATIPDLTGYTFGDSPYLQVEIYFGTDTLAIANNNVYLSNAQLEKGGIATDFEQRSVGEELLSCYRYFRKISQSNNGLGTAGYMYGDNGKKLLACESYPVPMRVSPTYTVTVAPTYENCSSLEIAGDDKGMIIRVVVASTGSFRAHSWALELDSEL